MVVIPQCMYCINAKYGEENIICNKYEKIPEKIKNGEKTCKYHEKPIK